MALVTRPRLRHVGIYCYVWLMLGFFSGTLLLVGPVRWITAFLREGGYRETTENAVMIGVIVLFVALSALLAWLAVKQMGRCRTSRTRLGIPLVLTIAAGLSLWAWSNPAVMAGAAGSVAGTVSVGGRSQFVFGPYPHRARLMQLKNEGYAGVISLQHPAVVPFEPKSIAEETRNTKEIGIRFIHAPMVPWISANEESLEKIRKVAREGRGRYYVHCGLGRDRTNVVKKMLDREGAQVAAGEGFKAARTFGMRYADGNRPMERGILKPLRDDVYLIPYPNKHELFGNMLSGQVSHVLILLDPSEAEQRPWIEEAQARLGEHHVPYTIETLHGGDARQAAALVRKSAQLARPLVIIVPFMAPRPDTAVVDTFLAAWGSGSAP